MIFSESKERTYVYFFPDSQKNNPLKSSGKQRSHESKQLVEGTGLSQMMRRLGRSLIRNKFKKQYSSWRQG